MDRPTSSSLPLAAAGAALLTLAGCDDRRATSPIPPLSIHYVPAENLEPYDVALIDQARRTIDLAAYVLTDKPVLEALERAAHRGVVVRILVDRGQLEDRPESAPLIALQDLQGVALRVRRGYLLMHQKSYAVDGRWFRSGAANLSASGLRQQNKDALDQLLSIIGAVGSGKTYAANSAVQRFL